MSVFYLKNSININSQKALIRVKFYYEKAKNLETDFGYQRSHEREEEGNILNIVPHILYLEREITMKKNYYLNYEKYVNIPSKVGVKYETKFKLFIIWVFIYYSKY